MSNAALKIQKMNIAEAAAYIASARRRPFSVKTLRNYLADGQGPQHSKLFGRLEFEATDLDAWMDFMTVTRKALGRR